MQAHEGPLSRVKTGIRATLSAANELTRLQLVVIGVLAAVVAAGALVTYVRSRPRAVEVTRSSGGQEKRTLSVHVAGAVARPGLYRMKEGSRVADALTEAGGAAPDGVIDDVNLAARLKDGEKVMVPRRAETPTASAASQTTDAPGDSQAVGAHPVNINTAGVAELETLPGIGPSFAKRIVEYRAQNGPFSSVDELDGIAGIGPRKLESLEGLVTI